MLGHWLLPASLLASGAAALLIQPTNITQNSGEVNLIVDNTVFGTLQNLTSTANDNLNMGIHDYLFHVTPQNQNNLTEQDVALISCDPRDYTGFLDLNDVYRTALGVNASAIILYSLTADQCNITDPESDYSRLYSMPNSTLAQALLDRINNEDHPFANMQYTSTSGNGNANTPQGSSTYGSSPTTAVAMIILYSVTGIITALFLIIIITGAVRAHRHPERYGPRNIMGRPRQTRARGIARAMLDTIPVIKFGEQPKPDPKPTDIELADTDTPVIRRSVENDGAQETDTRNEVERRQSVTSVRSGIGAAAGRPDPDAIAGTPAVSAEALGCSICTDDFETGQDLRVLPCDHMFHPACIDPWLLNVSSTCPLCRIDLRPEGSTETDAPVTQAGENGDLPPPINGYNGQPYRVSMRRSLLIGLGLDRGHIDQGQRMAAARELRELGPDNLGGTETQQQEQGEEGRQRRRLRERFGVRTRRRGQPDAQGRSVGGIPEETSSIGPTTAPEVDNHGRTNT